MAAHNGYPDFYAAKVIRASAAGIAGIALNGVDLSISHAFNDAHMVTFAIRLPIKEDDVAGTGGVAVILPLPSVLKPLDARRTPRKPRNEPCVNVAALFGHPAACRNSGNQPFGGCDCGFYHRGNPLDGGLSSLGYGFRGGTGGAFRSSVRFCGRLRRFMCGFCGLLRSSLRCLYGFFAVLIVPLAVSLKPFAVDLMGLADFPADSAVLPIDWGAFTPLLK
mgnify:CR=1 FL=1|jgi:hypothetical protein